MTLDVMDFINKYELRNFQFATNTNQSGHHVLKLTIFDPKIPKSLHEHLYNNISCEITRKQSML